MAPGSVMAEVQECHVQVGSSPSRPEPSRPKATPFAAYIALCTTPQLWEAGQGAKT
jgi:hypothetical protein